MKPAQFLFTALMVFTLTACGFHLRGNYTLPAHLKQMQLQTGSPYSSLTREVTQALKRGGVKLMTQSDVTYPTLSLSEEKFNQTTLSVYPNGLAAEYRLIATTTATLMLPEQTPKAILLQVQRYYQDEPQGTLAKSREREVIEDEMRKQLAEQLLIKLAAH